MTRGLDDVTPAMVRTTATPYEAGRMAAAFFSSSASTV